MAEISSIQNTKLNQGLKLNNAESLGRVKTVILESPSTAAWATGDTVASPVNIPAGARIVGYYVFNQAFGTGSSLSVGLRASKDVDPDQTVVGTDIIVNNRNVAAQAAFDHVSSSGSMLTGFEQVTDRVTNVFGTITGTTITANARFKIILFVSLAD